MKRDSVLTITSLSNEMKLLVALLAADNEGEGAAADEALYRDIEWSQFLALVRHHRVFPQLYVTLKRVPKAPIPPYVMQVLKRDYRQNTIRMLHLAGEMETIGHLLASNGIRALFLKGPSLAHQLYGDISLRTSGDIDLLIPLRDLDAADRLLQENGYEKEESVEALLGDWKWRRHHVNYAHPEKKTKVEVHWRLHPGPAKSPSFDELWERKAACKITNVALFQLGNDDLLLYLATHGARHGWSRLRWLADVDRLLKQTIAWGPLLRRARRNWQEQLLGQALLLATELLNTKVDERTSDLLRSNRAKRIAQGAMFYLERTVNLHSTPIEEEVASYHQRYLFALMGSRQKVLFVLSFLHPYSSDAQLLPLPKPLHFLYYPLRPVLWAWRRTKKTA